MTQDLRGLTAANDSILSPPSFRRRVARKPSSPWAREFDVFAANEIGDGMQNGRVPPSESSLFIIFSGIVGDAISDRNEMRGYIVLRPFYCARLASRSLLLLRKDTDIYLVPDGVTLLGIDSTRNSDSGGRKYVTMEQLWKKREKKLEHNVKKSLLWSSGY